MRWLIHKNGYILGLEPFEELPHVALLKYPHGSEAIEVDLEGFSLTEIRRNYRILDGKLVRRPIVSLLVSPQITLPGETVTITARVYHFLPEERRSRILLRVGDDTVEVPLAEDTIVPEHLVGEASYTPRAQGVHLIDLKDWPEADCVIQPLMVM